jgi:cytochrome bd ubiquinol oxidase subunit I
VLISLIGYAVVYLIMFPVGIALMARIVRAGPAEAAVAPAPVESGRPQGPVHALPVSEAEVRP